MPRFPSSPQQRLAADVREVRELQDAIGDRLEGFDERVLVVLAAGANADSLYKPSLQRLLWHLGDTSRRANIVLVQTDGTQFPQDFRPDDTERIDLEVAEKTVPGLAMPVYKQDGSPDEPYLLRDSQTEPHTLHVLHQPKSPYTGGKIGGLRDAFGMLLRSLTVRGSVPSQTLFMDAESAFYQFPGRVTAAPETDSDGVNPLLDLLEGCGAPHVIGARMRLCAYRTLVSGERVPDFDAPVSNMHAAINWAYGLPRHRYLSGGGIAGRTNTLLALGQTVSKYPGLRSEDLAELALAENADIPWGLTMDQMFTNLCPPAVEHSKAMQQLARWNHGKTAVRELYGIDNPEGCGSLERVAGRCLDAWYLLRDPRRALRILQNRRDIRAERATYPVEDPLFGSPEWTTS